MLKWFKRITAASTAEDQLYDAERNFLAHEAAAEHHEALSVMYAARVTRLREYLGQKDEHMLYVPGSPTVRLPEENLPGGGKIAAGGVAMLSELMREQFSSRAGIYPDGNPNAGVKNASS